MDSRRFADRDCRQREGCESSSSGWRIKSVQRKKGIVDMKFGSSRRSFLQAIGAASSFFAAPQITAAASLDGAPIVPIKSGLGSTGDIYAELGVTPLININGTLTVIGGSVMPPEVMEIIRRGNEHFVAIDELEIAAGKFIAKLCKSPEGYTGLV